MDVYHVQRQHLTYYNEQVTWGMYAEELFQVYSWFSGTQSHKLVKYT